MITRQEIDRTGKATVAEFLQTLTVDGAGSIPKSFGNGFAGGGAGVSLRGLGAGSTLVLLNGRRMAPYGLADDGQKVFTDLSTIPLEAVERIEMLKDGASAIYGSDAIAGVVNIILRKDFTGVVVKGSYGTSGDGDGNQRKGTLTAGPAIWPRTATTSSSASKVARPTPSASATAATASGSAPATSAPGDTTSAATCRVASPAAAPIRRRTDCAAIDPGTIGSAGSERTLRSLPGCAELSDVPPRIPGGGCLWEAGQFRNLSPRSIRQLLRPRHFRLLRQRRDVHRVRLFEEENHLPQHPLRRVRRLGLPRRTGQARAVPVRPCWAPNHPDNPLGEPSRLRYAAFDVGPRTINNDKRVHRFLVGLKGSWANGTTTPAYLHSETGLVNTRTGYLRYSAV